MMARSPDILFMAEYIKNVLYFATVRQGKVLKNTVDAHYFCIDNELVYENYYSDFGPLNLGCVYKYCRILNEKLKQFLNKQSIVHYTSIDPKKKANAAFLLGCYGVLYLSLPPKDALKPLMIHGQSYRPFQDATQGDSPYTISLMDCLLAIKKARDLGFFNFHDFNYEEYDRLNKIQGGDLNWIVPGKFLAFIGPVDYNVSLYHPPEMYIDYFLENNVKVVIRLNKRLYDGNVFSNAGITHFDLFFPDGSYPPRHILFKFLQISEDMEGAIAVHCKAGLGRTGSLIGCYLIKHYRMTAHEAIGWMRICRPGSVIGHQQGWLVRMEPWLLKQGDLYRKRMYQDIDNMPTHEFGVYSIAEKARKQRPVVFTKTPSPPPPMHRQTCSEMSPPIRPQASRVREDKSENEDEEIFLTSCDLTTKSTIPMTRIKGCIIKNSTISEEYDENDSYLTSRKVPFWKKYLFCRPCISACNGGIWILAVRCAKVTPNSCHATKVCAFLDKIGSNKATEKEHQHDWRVKTKMNNHKLQYRGDSIETKSSGSRRGSGGGEPRASRPPSQNSTIMSQAQRSSLKSGIKESSSRYCSGIHPGSQFQTTQNPIIKNVNDAKIFLMKSSNYADEREKKLNSSIKVTPRYSVQVPNYLCEITPPGNMTHIMPSSFSTASRTPTLPLHRRRLGRSPSPPPTRVIAEHSRATNTPSTAERFLAKDASKSALKEALSRLKLVLPRDGSVGAASLGARREAPAPMRAPSVRSDERPLATQGDMLNSIKFQRRLRETIHNADKSNTLYNDKISFMAKEKPRNTNSRINTLNRSGINQDLTGLGCTSRGMYHTARPASPKGRRNMQTAFY